MGQRKAALSVDSLSWTAFSPPHPESIQGGTHRTRPSPAHPGCQKLPSAVGGGSPSGPSCGPGSSPGLGWSTLLPSLSCLPVDAPWVGCWLRRRLLQSPECRGGQPCLRTPLIPPAVPRGCLHLLFIWKCLHFLPYFSRTALPHLGLVVDIFFLLAL